MSSLVLSGVSDGDLETMYERTITDFSRIATELSAVEGEEARAEMALTYLHETVFTRYSALQTRFDTVLINGSFNCVSSSVFYALLMQYLGYSVHGVVTKDHAFCRVILSDSQGFDVETTTPHGFNPGKKTEFTDDFGTVTGFSYVPPGNYRDRTDVTIVDLIALIAQNRMSYLEERNQYREALAIGVDRFAFYNRDPLQRAEFIRGVQNLIAQYNRKQQYAEALSLLNEVVDVYGQEGFSEMYSAMLNNRCLELVKAGRSEEARVLYDSAVSRNLVSSSVARDISVMISESILSRVVENGPLDQSRIAIMDAWTRRDITIDRRNEYIVYIYSKEIQTWLSRQDFERSLELVEEALTLTGGSTRLTQIRTSVNQAIATDYHNRFATLFNAGKRTEAFSVLDEGLGRFPRDSRLLRDKSLSDTYR